MQVTESGNSFLDYSLPICWALRNRKYLLAFLIYEGTIRPEWLTPTTQVPKDSTREEPQEAAACRVSLCSEAAGKPQTLERQVKYSLQLNTVYSFLLRGSTDLCSLGHKVKEELGL